MKYSIALILLWIAPIISCAQEEESKWVKSYANACSAYFQKHQKLPTSELDLEGIPGIQPAFVSKDEAILNKFVFCSPAYKMSSLSDKVHILCMSISTSKSSSGLTVRFIIMSDFRSFFITDEHLMKLLSGKDPNDISNFKDGAVEISK